MMHNFMTLIRYLINQEDLVKELLFLKPNGQLSTTMPSVVAEVGLYCNNNNQIYRTAITSIILQLF